MMIAIENMMSSASSLLSVIASRIVSNINKSTDRDVNTTTWVMCLSMSCLVKVRLFFSQLTCQERSQERKLPSFFPSSSFSRAFDACRGHLSSSFTALLDSRIPGTFFFSSFCCSLKAFGEKSLLILLLCGSQVERFFHASLLFVPLTLLCSIQQGYYR